MKTFILLSLVLGQGQVQSQWSVEPIKSQWSVESSQWHFDIEKTDKKEGYVEACDRAISLGKPLIVFVGCDDIAVPGSVVVRVDHLQGYNGPTIVVSSPENGLLYFVKELKASASVASIRQAAGLEVSRSAFPFDPFSWSNSRKKSAQLDRHDEDSHGQWLTSGRLIGMQRYRPATTTQSIFKSGDMGGPSFPYIEGVSRASIEEKYQVPGGLVGVSGWRSMLYKYLPEPARERIDFTKVVNSIRRDNRFGGLSDDQYKKLFKDPNDGFFSQQEYGHRREYPDGTEFDDVLVNEATGKVFEHRVAQKIDGRWERFIAFKDPSERPAGYVPPKSGECVSCHLEAGSGGYGVGLVPGGDTVLSDPFSVFPALGERRRVR